MLDFQGYCFGYLRDLFGKGCLFVKKSSTRIEGR